MISSLLLILLIAIGNLCFGYQLAVYLGQGLSFREALHTDWRTRTSYQALEEEFPDDVAETLQHDEPEEDLDLQSFLGHDDPAGDDLNEAGADILNELAETPTEPESNLFELAYESMSSELALFNRDLVQLDTQLREPSETPLDMETLTATVKKMTNAVQRLLPGYKSATDPILQSKDATPESEQARSRVSEAIEQLAEKTNGILNTLTELSAEDAELADFSRQLLEACHEMRFQVEEPLMEIAQLDHGLHNIDLSLYKDEATNLSDRLGLEAALADWSRNDPKHLRPLSLALIDMDQMQEINQNSGVAVGDQVIAGVASLVQSVCGKYDIIARIAGQQFVVLCSDAEPQAAFKLINLLLPTISNTPISIGEAKYSVTVSAAVTKFGDEETSGSILSRLRQSVRQSKQQSGNLAVICETVLSEPVPSEPEMDEPITAPSTDFTAELEDAELEAAAEQPTALEV